LKPFLRILLVDDERISREGIRQVLTREGYSVNTADSGKDALEKLALQRYDLVLLDIRLPGISGFELQEQLLAAGTQMPVIFLTGQDRAGMEEHAMRLGASAYLRKPVDEEILLDAIRHAMKSPSKEKEKGNGMDRTETS